MTSWRKKHNDEIELGPKNRMSVKTVLALAGVLIYFTGWFVRMDYKMSESVSRDQAQQWIDNMREQNRSAFPALVVPALPPKQAYFLSIKPTIATKE